MTSHTCIVAAVLGIVGAAAGQDHAASGEHPPNGLANETSPYLLQHVHNPVNWQPWGEAAFETARRENKPIFLSIGYSTERSRGHPPTSHGE